MADLKVGDSFPSGVTFSYVPYTPEKGDVTSCGIPINYDASKGTYFTYFSSLCLVCSELPDLPLSELLRSSSSPSCTPQLALPPLHSAVLACLPCLALLALLERALTSMRSIEWAGKKVVVFSVPGAFTPGCSAKHLPGFIANLSGLKTKGVDVVACIAFNDAWVMSAWGKANGIKDEIVSPTPTQHNTTQPPVPLLYMDGFY